MAGHRRLLKAAGAGLAEGEVPGRMYMQGPALGMVPGLRGWGHRLVAPRLRPVLRPASFCNTADAK
jgi:hypothetical protein